VVVVVRFFFAFFALFFSEFFAFFALFFSEFFAFFAFSSLAFFTFFAFFSLAFFAFFAFFFAHFFAVATAVWHAAILMEAGAATIATSKAKVAAALQRQRAAGAQGEECDRKERRQA
jgi:hypothetical protein